MNKPGSRHVLMVGSVPLPDTESVMRAVAGALGDRAPRITDGETGSRINWIEGQTPIFDKHPLFQLADQDRGLDADWRNKQADKKWQIKGWHALKPGAKAEDVVFGTLGYAKAAIESYAVFNKLKKEGVIGAKTRLQVSLPTPYNVIDQRVVPEQRVAVEVPYERAMLKEVAEMAAAIPHSDLALQWDVAHEIQNLDGGRPHWFPDPEKGIVERLARLGDAIPSDIELGYHLCYGDFNHRHFIEPKDTTLMVRVANALSQATKRTISWIHMPVPIARNDDAYFAPLKDLKLKPGTELYLGLIHYTDGVDGTRKRVATAEKYAPAFGVACECGFGRRKPETVPELLRIHAQIADTHSAHA